MNFEFCLSFDFASASLHFPLLRTLKIISYMFKYFLNFVWGILKSYFLYVKIVFELCFWNPKKFFSCMLKQFWILKSYFLYVKIVFEFCFRNPKKFFSCMLKQFWILKGYFLYVKIYLKESSIYITLRIILYNYFTKMIFYGLNNKFSYIQLSFVFLLQKDSYFDHDYTDAFSLFLPQEDFYICITPFFTFFLFLLQKDFGIFCVILFEAFLCFSIICVNHFYICIQKKL